jgi:hypothetical protein
MAAYMNLLGEATYLRAGNQGPVEVGEVTSEMASRKLISTMARVHVRRQLSELALALSQAAAALGPGTAREAVDRAREDCERTAAMLPVVRFRPLALTPFLIPLLGLLSKEGPSWLGIALVAAAIVLVVGLLAACMVIWMSYRCKRELFLPGAKLLDKSDPSAQEQHDGWNVYRVEDLAFGDLGWCKRPELEVDRTVRWWAMILVFEAAIVASVVVDGGRYAWTEIVFVALLGVSSSLMARREKQRIWR